MSDWQPIETAPKDKHILIYYAADELVWPAYWEESTHEWIVPDSFDPPLSQPDVTHWQPLPAPPESTE